MNNYIAWAKDSLAFGFSGIYEREFLVRYGVLVPNYPPIPLFLFATFYWLYEWVYRSVWALNSTIGLFPSNLIFFLEDQDTLPAFLKIPSILADIGIALVVFLFAQKLMKKRKSRWPLLAASLVLFNPAFFYNSAYWGQVEAIPLFFVLASFYLLLYSQRYFSSSILFTLALLSKQTSAVFIPLFALILFKNFGFRNCFKACLTSVSFFWIIFLPFYKGGNLLLFPFLTYWEKIQTASASDYATDHAFNLWFLLGLDKVSDSGNFLLGLSFREFGFIILGLVLLTTLYILYRRGFPILDIFSGVAVIAFAAFLFLTRMHERHLEQALPFMLLAGLKNSKIFGVFLVVSLFHFVNLYHDWWAPRVGFLVDILSAPATVNALIILAIGSFLFLFIQYLKE